MKQLKKCLKCRYIFYFEIIVQVNEFCEGRCKSYRDCLNTIATPQENGSLEM